MWEQLRWARLVPAGGSWYTSINTVTGGIPVCSPARTLPVGNGWDHAGTVGNRWYVAQRAGFPCHITDPRRLGNHCSIP